DGPVAVADSASGTENQTLTINVLANDTDVDDGHVFTLNTVSAPSGKGTASVVANQVQFVPGTDFDHLAKGAVEHVTLSYTMQDQFGATSSSTVDVTITGTNDIATITGDFSGEVKEDGPLATGGKVTVADVDSGEDHFLAPANLIGKYGVFTFNADTGVWGYTLNYGAAETLPTGQVAHDKLTVMSADGSDSKVIDVSITSTNDAPIIKDGVEAHQPNLAAKNGQLVFDGQYFFGDDDLKVSDPDGLQFGIAIVGLDNAAGFWEYKIAGSEIWHEIPEVPEGQAFVLSATDSVRFIGPARESAEMLHFRAWDGTDHSADATLVTLPLQPGGSTAFSTGIYTVGAKNNGPAGIAGEPINLGLADSALVGQTVTVTIGDLPSDWIINGGTHNADGSWTVKTTDVASLTVTTVASFTGAVLISVTETMVQADGTITTFSLSDNLEAYAAGSPIFAWSGDDFLTASSGKDLLVFAQPIGHDTIYSFDVANDQIDLIAYADFAGFADVQAHLSEDAAGNAVITLGTGQSITLEGVDEAALTDVNFVFNQTAVLTNAGLMTIGDGAFLPLSGTINNSGVIELNSSGHETDLQLIEHGVTLQGGGQILLSDSDDNVISGTSPAVTLNNTDNTISGAGHLGDGELRLTNAGTIDADGTHVLAIDTGTNIIINSGVLEASGSGGLTVASSVANSGVLWANGGSLTVLGEVTENGVAQIDGAGTLDFEAASSANVIFGSDAAGTLKLGDSFHFTGTITGFSGSDTIDLANLEAATASLSYHENATGTGGTLRISDGLQTVDLAFLGSYSSDNFSLAADQAKGTLVHYVPHDLIV
ncbi:MAG: VCBS domain-containing protein, partial [Bradyrhizobium sp.]